MALFDRRKNDGTVIAQEAGKPNTPSGMIRLRL